MPHYHDNALQFIQRKLVCMIFKHTNTFTHTHIKEAKLNPSHSIFTQSNSTNQITKQKYKMKEKKYNRAKYFFSVSVFAFFL